MNGVQYYFLCFLLCLLFTILLKSFFNSSTKSKTHLALPPSPPALPLIGHIHLLGPLFHESMQKLSSKYGPIFHFRLGASQMVVVSSAAMATEIFKIQDLTFAEHPKLGFSDEVPYAKNGFFSAPYGEYWRFVKKLCTTELLSPRQLERSYAIRKDELDRFLHRILESANKKDVVDVGAELMKITNNTICRMAMSTRSSEKADEANEVRELVKESFELGSKMFLGDMFGPLRKLAFWLFAREAKNVLTRFDGLLEKFLKDHEDPSRKRDHEDLMDMLLKVHGDDKAEVKMTRIHLKALLADLFVGSTGTTSEAILWTIAELINHPKAFNKLREEIQSVVGRTRLVEESDVESLPYLQAVVKEALRLYPPLPVITRACRENCKLDGFDIPQNMTVAVNLSTIMRDPNLWENPNEFWPERFLVSSKKQENMEETLNFLPFGAGRRACPGARLALCTLHITVAAMVQCFDWKLGGEGDEGKVNMEVEKGFFMHLAHPLKCLPVVRFNPSA